MSRVFNGTTDQLNTPANAVYNNLAEFTWSAWVKPASAGGNSFGTIFVKDPVHAYGPYLQFDGSTKLQGVSGPAASLGSSVTNEALTLNVWSHVAMSFKLAGDAKIHIYINGVEATYSAETAVVGPLGDDSADGYYFGNDTFGDGWDGSLAEMAEWNVQLTPTQIVTLAASTTGAAAIAPTNLVGYWHLCGTASPEPDATANGDNATVAGTTTGSSSPGYICTSPINLLTNATVAVSAGSTIPNTGNTTLYGDLDLSPGSVASGFPPGTVTGTQHIDDATAIQSQLDVTTAYNQAAAASGAITIATALDAVTLASGVYTSAAGTFSLSGGTLTLDAQGNANAVWIFQMATTLTTTAGSVVQVINGGLAKNVFWAVGSSATIGTTNTFVGTILAHTSITVQGTGTTVAGGLLANAAVNLSDVIVTVVAPPNPPSRVYNTAPGTSPINTPFSVSLLATDNFDVPSAVTQDTNILLTMYTGTGALSGTVTGTILSGQSTATISGVMYNVAEAGVSFFATSTSGDSLAHFINGTTTTFTAPPGFNVSGSLGVVGAGLTVSYSGTSSGSVKADAFGNYTIFLANGTYTITPGLYNFIPASMTVTVNNANITGVNFLLHYSEPDCRNFAIFPNLPVNVNGTLTYTVPSVDSRVNKPADSRVSKPVASGTYPQNSRAPGTFGPNE